MVAVTSASPKAVVFHFISFHLIIFTQRPLSSQRPDLPRSLVKYTYKKIESNTKGKISNLYIEPFYIDHKRLNLSNKTRLLQLKLLNFNLLIDERGGDKLKLNHWHKSKYRTV